MTTEGTYKQWTYEELQDLSGLELRRLVAEELGWTDIRVLPERDMMSGCHPLYTVGKALHWIPEYHRNLPSAMLVVEHFRQKWALGNKASGEPTYWALVDQDGRWHAEIWWAHHDGHVVDCAAHDEQLPVAICRAALMHAYGVSLPSQDMSVGAWWGQ